MWKNSLTIFIGLFLIASLFGCSSASIPEGTPPSGLIIDNIDDHVALTKAAAVNHMATSMGVYVCQNLEGELIVYISSDVSGRVLLQDFWRQFQVFKTMRSSADPESSMQLFSRLRNIQDETTWTLVLRRKETILWSDTVLLEK